MSNQTYIQSRTLWILALCLFVCTTGWTQFTNKRIIDVKDGLSDNDIHLFAQDQFGFIWVGTENGLNRFDGSQFKQFVNDKDDPSSLMATGIHVLQTDSTHVWIGGSLGFSTLDLTDHTIENYQFDCHGLLDTVIQNYPDKPHVRDFEKQGDIVYVSTRSCGLVKFNISTKDFVRFTFEHLQEDPNDDLVAARLNSVYAIVQDPQQDSTLWLGTGGGLIEFNKYTETAEYHFYQHEDIVRQDAKNSVRNMVVHENGNIYYYTWSAHVSVFNRNNHSFSDLPERTYDIPYHKGGIHGMQKWDDHRLWIEYTYHSVIYDTRTSEIEKKFKNDPIEGDHYRIDLIDSDGRIWMATKKGIHLFDPLLQQYDEWSFDQFVSDQWHVLTRDVALEKDGRTLTMSGQGAEGLIHYDIKDGSSTETKIPVHLRHDPSRVHIFGIADRPDGFWVLSGLRRLYLYYPENRSIKPFPLELNMSRDLFTNCIWDKSGDLWIPTRYDGLFRWSPEENEIQHYKFSEYAHPTEDIPFRITNAFVDSRNNVWFTRRGGYMVYLRNEDRFHFVIFESPETRTLKMVKTIIEDSNGYVWIHASNGFMGKIPVDNPTADVMEIFSIYDLADHKLDYLESICSDESGNIWCLSDRGLYKVDENLNIDYFSFEYTDFPREFFLFERLPDGRLTLGLRNKVAVLDPNNIEKNTSAPRPYITDLKVLEESRIGDPFQHHSQIRLKANENFLSFYFSSLSFTLPDKDLFQYRLRGFDPSWIEAGDRRFVNYTNIPSGDYVFELKSTNNEGIWNDEAVEMAIIIATPWYETLFFQIVFALLTLMLVYGIYRYRIFQIRKEHKIKEDYQKKLANVELSALRAQMNPHFIFNSLNSIESFIIKNEPFKAAEYINDFARLIRLILQNSRSQYVRLQDELEALDLYLMMESLRFDNKFEYRINISDEVEQNKYEIPPMLIQPYVENAIWHGLMHKDDRGKVEIDISRQNGFLRCVIDDNGIGRKRSFEIKKNKKVKGKKSMGMQITEDRINTINEIYNTNTRVEIIDKIDKDGNALGTKILLDIPV